MYFDSIRGKKVLLLGGVGATLDLIELAHRNGVFIGVADYNKGTMAKKLADAAHDINALDVDAVVKLMKEENYEGIVSQFSDMLSPYVAEIAERMGTYSPFNVEQLRMSTDKKYFKDTCNKYGVPVPREYEVDSIDAIDTADISYPVIIKPVDNGGSKGISICHDKEELKKGYEVAQSASRQKRVIIEDFIPFDEINVTYICQDGDVQLAAIHDRYFNSSQEGYVRVPDMYIYPSRYTDIYLEKYNSKVIEMIKGIGIKNGSLFMQACVKDNQVYFYEAGMRLNGCKTYQILEVENNYNTFERLMNYSITGSMGDHAVFNPKFKRWYATWNIVGEPGEICARFEGKKELETYPWVIKASTRYQEGEKIPENSKGTLGQLVGRFHIYADTKEQLVERIDKMQRLFQVYNNEGEKVLLKPHDVENLRKMINYDI